MRCEVRMSSPLPVGFSRGGRLVGRWYMPTAEGYVIGIFDILRSSHGMDSNPIQSVMYDFWQYYNL